MGRVSVTWFLRMFPSQWSETCCSKSLGFQGDPRESVCQPERSTLGFPGSLPQLWVSSRSWDWHCGPGSPVVTPQKVLGQAFLARRGLSAAPPTWVFLPSLCPWENRGLLAFLWGSHGAGPGQGGALEQRQLVSWVKQIDFFKCLFCQKEKKGLDLEDTSENS